LPRTRKRQVVKLIAVQKKWRREGGFGSYRRGVGMALEALARIIERRWQARQ
jgi:hypothetical protein